MFEEGRALIAGVFCYRRKGVELFLIWFLKIVLLASPSICRL